MRHGNVDAVGKPGHITYHRGAAELGNSAGSDPWADILPPRVNREAAACSPVPASAIITLWDSANRLVPLHLSPPVYNMTGLNQLTLRAPPASRNGAGTGTRRDVGCQGPSVLRVPSVPHCPFLEAAPSSGCQSGSSCRCS